MIYVSDVIESGTLSECGADVVGHWVQWDCLVYNALSSVISRQLELKLSDHVISEAALLYR